MARDSREPVRRPAVDPRDEPSVEWGWHGGFPRATVVAGVVSIAVLLVMISGPYQSFAHVPWILGIVAVIVLGLLGQAARRRHSWRR